MLAGETTAQVREARGRLEGGPKAPPPVSLCSGVAAEQAAVKLSECRRK
jgi:hypothetical protein